MAIRDESTSSVELFRDARFHRRALLCDPQAMHLADGVKLCESALAKAVAVVDEKEEEQVGTQAEATRAEFVSDKRVRVAELELLAHVEKDRRHPDYVYVLSGGLSPLVALSGEEAERAVRAFVDRLATRVPALAEKHGPLLVSAAADSSAAHRRYREAVAATHAARGGEYLARLDLVQRLRRNEGALAELFPGDRGRVRSYFRRQRRSESLEVTPESETPIDPGL